MLHEELAVEMNDWNFVLILVEPLTTFRQSDVDLDQFDLKQTTQDNNFIQGFTSKSVVKPSVYTKYRIKTGINAISCNTNHHLRDLLK